MNICPACSHENLPGADQCEECGVSLTLEDTNPEYRNHAPDSITEKTIGDVPLRDTILVSPQTNLQKVVEQMHADNLGCVLVSDKNKIVGIFTERDLLYKIKKEDTDLSQLEVEHFMTPNPEVLSEDDTLAMALNKMAIGQFRHVPVKRKSGSYTFMGVRDALRFLF